MSINSLVKEIRASGKAVTLIGSDLTLEGAARTTSGFLVPLANIVIKTMTPAGIKSALDYLSNVSDTLNGDRFTYLVKPSGKTATAMLCLHVFPPGMACYFCKCSDVPEYYSVASGKFFPAISKKDIAKAEKAEEKKAEKKAEKKGKK